jgi:peptide-methionine (S)-S-oxide reductase
MRPTLLLLSSLFLIVGIFGIGRGAGAAEPVPAGAARAIFAGGCFWCMEPPFESLDGVYAVNSGYTGGRKEQPTYEEVSSGSTGHTEAIEILYDKSKVKYETLLDIFWKNIDPLAKDYQFCDHGSQYRSGIYPLDAAQQAAAEASKKALAASGRFQQPIVTEIVAAGAFWQAEDYHQDYYKKNPIRYKFYRNGCGRDARLRELWGENAGH